MHFLMLSTKYPVEPGQSWMSSDLADALRARGHDLTVVLIDWNAAVGRATRTLVTATGVNVLDIAPRALTGRGLLAYRISKMLLSPRHALKEMKRLVDPKAFDAMIAFTPASTLAGPIRFAKLIATRVLFIFDFYPIYQREIGMIPSGPVYQVALRREEALYRSFTKLVCNLPSNMAYLRKNYRLRADQAITSNPLWSDISPVVTPPRNATRDQYGLPLDRPIAIFGGQITDGRGIELMLDAACLARETNSPLHFLFIGEGRLVDLVKAAATQGNVQHIGAVSRDTYLGIASSCDVGLVATVAGVSSFNFPTKTIDYLRVGLPVVAAVEPGSDYTDILTTHRVGSSADYSDPEAFFKAAEHLALDVTGRADMQDRARRCLDEVFNVELAADLVLDSVATTTADNISQR
jgi:glycosyltransferase involved in cell wall biosynthesis